MIAGPEQDKNNLKYTWEVTEVDGSAITFQLNFEDPQKVSGPIDNDRVLVEIADPTFFAGREGRDLQDTMMIRPPTMLEFDIIRQIDGNDENTKTLESSC